MNIKTSRQKNTQIDSDIRIFSGRIFIDMLMIRLDNIIYVPKRRNFGKYRDKRLKCNACPRLVGSFDDVVG